MAPQKPTSRSPTKRVGLPKPPAPEPAHGFERPAYRELPTDISSLANILESAMTSVVSGPPATARVVEEMPVDPQPPAPAFQRRKTDDAEGLAHPAVGAGQATQPEAVAFDEVARSLGAAEACVPLLAQSTGLLRIAALDVVKAETARAGGLLQLLRFLRGDLTPARTAVSTSAVLQRVVQAAESERRLRNIALTSRSSVGDATCGGDETLLVNTLLAMVLTTFAAIDGVLNARVLLSVTMSDEREIGVSVSQEHVAAPAAWLSRAGSDELTAESGQALPAIALSAAHRLARQWRGRFAIASGEHSSILTLWLPTVQPEEHEHIPH